MIGGIKIWREPNGIEWTVAFYETPACEPMLIGRPDDIEHARITEWLENHYYDASYERSIGLVQFTERDEQRNAESAMLFRLHAAPAVAATIT